MKYKNDAHRARYSAALKAAQNLAAVACYDTASEPAIIAPGMSDGVSVAASNLVLLPSSAGYPHWLARAVEESLSTVLLIELGATIRGEPTFYFTIVRKTHDRVEWRPGRRLWADDQDRLYLVPDPDGDDPDAACYIIDRGVRPAPCPWTSETERDAWLRVGDALLLAP